MLLVLIGNVYLDNAVLMASAMTQSIRLRFKGWQVRDLPEALCCVLEQDTLSSA